MGQKLLLLWELPEDLTTAIYNPVSLQPPGAQSSGSVSLCL